MNIVVPCGLGRFTTLVWSESGEEGYKERQRTYSDIFKETVDHCVGWYNNMLRDGVPVELAEQILPRCVELSGGSTAKFRGLEVCRGCGHIRWDHRMEDSVGYRRCLVPLCCCGDYKERDMR